MHILLRITFQWIFLVLTLAWGVESSGQETKSEVSTPPKNLVTKLKSLKTIAQEYFEAHANQELTQQEITSHMLSMRPDAQDPWRTVRELYEEGWLIKVKKGVYKRDPEYQGQVADEHFTEAVRKQIYERDHSRCVVCGNGPHNGYEIHADHIRPRHLGGLSTLENGQTLQKRTILCSSRKICAAIQADVGQGFIPLRTPTAGDKPMPYTNFA